MDLRSISLAFCAVIAMTIGFVESAQASNEREAIELNNLAVKSLSANNFEEAINHLRASLKLNPSYEIARTNLGIAYNNLALVKAGEKQYEDALMLFDQASFISPDNRTTKENVVGTIKLLGKNPGVAQDRSILGDMMMKKGALASAIVEYEAALRLGLDDTTIQKEKEAKTSFTTAEPELMQIHMKQLSAMELGSSSHPVPNTGAQSLASVMLGSVTLGSKTGVFEHGTTPSSSRSTTSSTPSTGTSAATISSSALPKSSSTLSISKTTSADPSDIVLSRIAEHLKNGMYVSVIDETTKLIATYPSSPRLYYLRARAHYHRESLMESVMDAKQALVLKNDYLDALATKGDAEQADGKYKDAAQTFTRAIEAAPTLSRFYSDRATVEELDGQSQKAADDKKKAESLTGAPYKLEGEPDSVDYGDYMAATQKTIKGNWFPPKNDKTYKAVTRFKIHSDGRISDVRVFDSAGKTMNDSAALSAVQASKLPPLPAGSPPNVDLEFTFEYKVTDGKGKKGSKEASSYESKKTTAVSPEEIKKMVEEEVERRLKEREEKEKGE